MKVTVKAPGSCGELAQGTLDGNSFLITCPVNVYSSVTVSPTKLQQHRYLSSRPGRKLRTAIIKTLRYLAISERYFQVETASELPVGKGMASSSADISAACQAVALSAAGRRLTPDELAEIALSIEPTDGIFYPGIMLFDHISGRLRRPLGQPPALHIAVFDAGGMVNTVHFNSRQDLQQLNRANEDQVKEAVRLITEGLTLKDSSLIGQGATLSALANQSILYKPQLETILQISRQHGAAGVNAAHSGTVVGALFPGNNLQEIPACIAAVRRFCPDVKYLRTVQLIAGGLQDQIST